MKLQERQIASDSNDQSTRMKPKAIKKDLTIKTFAVVFTVLTLTVCTNGSHSEALAATPVVTSPDGQLAYECGPERQSAEGCFNAWTKTILNGEEGKWVTAYCRDKPNAYNSGGCHGGGVPWWWWNGTGKIGDPVLKDFWFRDYAGPEINGVFRNDNYYGDARLIRGTSNCYKAKGSTFCMKFMNTSNAQH